MIAAFADFLDRDKGLVPSTIRACCSRVRAFLDRVGSTASDSLGRITVTQLDEALAAYVAAGGYARATVQEIVGKLRAFFRYAEMSHWCRPGLAAAIKAPRGPWRSGTIPCSCF
jgi:site-specific recombinase XerD